MLAPRRPPHLLLAALGVGVGLVVAALASSPRVTDFTPSAGASGAPGLSSVSITFSQEMQSGSVETRFRIEPAQPGVFRWEGRRMTFVPKQPWPEDHPVRVTLSAGGLSLRGLPMAQGLDWSFSVGAGQVAYLWPAGGSADIYLWSPESPDAERLTQSDEGISDFNIGPEATSLVYTAAAETGTEIVEVHLEDRSSELLHTCPPPASCASASLSPDRELLAFVQTELTADGVSLRKVMVAPAAGGEPYPVAGTDNASSQPAWSSRGWLALYDHTLAAYRVYDLVTTESARQAFVIPNELGEAPAWSPNGEHLVLAEIVFLLELPEEDEERPPRFYSHLQRIAVRDGTRLDLSGDEDQLVEDSGPAFAPDGSWIAFSRRSLDPAAWSLGRQLWRMRPDGVDAAPLTDAAELNHAGLSWSLDGARLAYMVFDQLNPTEPATIWWRWADGREGGQVAAAGYSPKWIP